MRRFIRGLANARRMCPGSLAHKFGHNPSQVRNLGVDAQPCHFGMSSHRLEHFGKQLVMMLALWSSYLTKLIGFGFHRNKTHLDQFRTIFDHHEHFRIFSTTHTSTHVIRAKKKPFEPVGTHGSQGGELRRRHGPFRTLWDSTEPIAAPKGPSVRSTYGMIFGYLGQHSTR